jgi:hypothetical protein
VELEKLVADDRATTAGKTTQGRMAKHRYCW